LFKGVKVKMLRGTTKTKWTVLAWLLFGLAGRAMAEHGALTTNVRDGWVDPAVADLVAAGLVDPPAQPLSKMTNLEVAQLTSRAAQTYLAQAQVPPSPLGKGAQIPASAAKSLQELAQEFSVELSAMDVDVFKLENRIYDQEHRNEQFESLQAEYLKQTGTNLSVYSRAYMDTYRGFGPNAVYGAMDYNDILFGDLIFKSVPTPFVLFTADLRLIRTIGLYYADPIQPEFNLHWISLTNTNEIANLTAGDFYRHYTPLTLWNYEIPVYTLVEPTSYYRTRKDVEELVYMDHGPDWHMRGFEAASDQALDKSFPALSSVHLQAMAGELDSATQYSFANDYAGGEAALDFFDNNLELKGTGLLLWDDTGSATIPYIPGLFQSYARQYQVGSFSASGTAPLDQAVSLTASAEIAGSFYQDDSNNTQSDASDAAVLVNGGIHVDDIHLTLKYLDTGAYFYSPGAQTNRYTPAMGTIGYLNGNQNLDDALSGYLNNYVFQGVNRPAFAPYDRMAENILPYGDATPNRQGFVLAFSAGLGKGGWLKPQAVWDLDLQELQPDYVGGTTAVDGLTTTRSFGGYEGALTADLAKALDGMPKTCALSVDYKHQTTDLGTGAPPFSVDTFIASADAGPFPHVPLFEGLVVSLAYEWAQSTGSEYVLTGEGSPPTLAQYATYFDNSLIGAYSYQALDISRASWAFGFKCPLSSTFEIHGDWFINEYIWADQPDFDRREQIWRLTYEVSF
jgi:hypothetical protein